MIVYVLWGNVKPLYVCWFPHHSPLNILYASFLNCEFVHLLQEDKLTTKRKRNDGFDSDDSDFEDLKGFSGA